MFYLPGVCTHTDIEGKQRNSRVRNILKSSKKTQYSMNTLYNSHISGWGPDTDCPRSILLHFPWALLFVICNYLSTASSFIHIIFNPCFFLVCKTKRELPYRVFIKYCVFSKILKYSGLLPFSVSPRCQCVHTPGRKNTSAAAELAEFRKITKGPVHSLVRC